MTSVFDDLFVLLPCLLTVIKAPKVPRPVASKRSIKFLPTLFNTFSDHYLLFCEYGLQLRIHLFLYWTPELHLLHKGLHLQCMRCKF
jgi:hypothetical protein